MAIPGFSAEASLSRAHRYRGMSKGHHPPSQRVMAAQCPDGNNPLDCSECKQVWENGMWQDRWERLCLTIECIPYMQACSPPPPDCGPCEEVIVQTDGNHAHRGWYQRCTQGHNVKYQSCKGYEIATRPLGIRRPALPYELPKTIPVMPPPRW
jgi:hypothetical protein